MARVAATRANLLRSRQQLARVRKGTQVVRRKRQALVAHLFRIARPAVDARAGIDRKVVEAYPSLLEALAIHGRDALRALSWPSRRIDLEAHPRQIWGVGVADIECMTPVKRTLESRGLAPGSTGPAVDAAADRFEELTAMLLDAASAELRVSRLAAAVSQTSQQLHVLEQRLEPSLLGEIAGVRRTLEEREREEHLRLKHLQKGRRAVGP